MADEPTAGRFHLTLGDPNDVGCSLDTESLDERVGEWSELLTHAERRLDLDDGVRIEFRSMVPSEELMRLVIAEQSCCSFFEFSIQVDRSGVALEVRSEPASLDVVRALFG